MQCYKQWLRDAYNSLGFATVADCCFLVSSVRIWPESQLQITKKSLCPLEKHLFLVFVLFCFCTFLPSFLVLQQSTRIFHCPPTRHVHHLGAHEKSPLLACTCKIIYVPKIVITKEYSEHCKLFIIMIIIIIIIITLFL